MVNFIDLSPVKKQIEFEVPPEVVAAEEKRLAIEYSQEADLPGFRRGKVPVSYIRSRFAKELHKEVMDNLISNTFYNLMKEHGLKVVGDPRIDHQDDFALGVPLHFRVEFEIQPTFELGEYRGIEVDDPKVEVTEHDIESMIEQMREQAASYRLEDTGRGIQDGDVAVIDIHSTWDDGKSKDDHGHFRVGEESPLPEMHEQLQGKVPGDTVTVEKEYGDDVHEDAWRGKRVRHDITLREIRVQEKPEVTDEFAQSMGGWETVEEMREAIAADIRKHREAEVARMKRNQIGERLVEMHNFEVPSALVEEELGKSLQNYARFLATQGVDLDRANLDWPKLGKDFRPEAARRARRTLILDAIARKENLTVSDVEVDAEIRRVANETEREFAEARKMLKDDGGYEKLRQSMAQERALDLLVRESRTK
jgi:trigger factor